MNVALLDNPAWHALSSHHQHLAIKGETAARYQPDVFLVAALSENKSTEFHELNALVPLGDMVIVTGSLPTNLIGWEVVLSSATGQMVCEELKHHPQRNTITLNAIPLTTTDVPEMLDLVRLAQPGPFARRTVEMGHYIGLRENGKLVAMAGERVHLPGFCEISAICTHPDYRGRGYGTALTTLAAARIVARQEVPFLHVLPTNKIAMKLYEQLGFRFRKEMKLTTLKRIA
ncbi:MAG TPA: GNAT family N-acetyltransferase [Caldilineaceae bacterium]|nr:GNAT family N-acetyltransferase [Caldilineaceae bacterium]